MLERTGTALAAPRTASSLVGADTTAGASGASNNNSTTAGATYDATPVAVDDSGYVPRPQAGVVVDDNGVATTATAGVSLDDTDDRVLTLTSSDGRMQIRIENGGDAGAKVTTFLDRKEINSQFFNEGDPIEFTLAGGATKVSLDIDEYQTGGFMGIADNDQHKATLTVTDTASGATSTAKMEDGEKMTAAPVMGDDALADLVYELTGQDISGQANTRLVDGDLLPDVDQQERRGSSVFLGDFGTGYIEFGPEIPTEGNGPSINLMMETTDENGDVKLQRYGGLLPLDPPAEGQLASSTGSIGITQENGRATNFKWSFRQEGDKYVLDHVQVSQSWTDENGEARQREWKVGPSGDEFQAMFSELDMTYADYFSFYEALKAHPGFQKFETQE